MSKIRLESGFFEEDGKDVSDAAYDRPVMLVYTGSFESMDGPVDITDNHIERLASEHNTFLSKVKRMATGDIPMKEYPPVQLDHSTSAAHTVGRLIGDLQVGETDIGGDKKKALFGTIRFLGKENVEKAKDGRWTHVSIGADLEIPKINELSVTPFPAAPNASLLSKKRLASYKGVEYEIVPVDTGEYEIYVIVNGTRQKVAEHSGSPEDVDAEARRYIDTEQGESTMHDKLKKHLMDSGVDKKDAAQMAEQIFKHHMYKMEKDEKEMAKHLDGAGHHEMKRLADEYKEHMAKMAEEETSEQKMADEPVSEEKMEGEKEGEHLAEEEKKDEKLAEEEKKEDKHLAKRQAAFLKLAKGIKQESIKLQSEMTRPNVAAKLSKLKLEGKVPGYLFKKVTPKVYDGMTAGELKAFLSAFELMEPVVQFGSMKGTTKAEAIEKVASKYRLARLELESRMNMPSKKEEASKRLSKLMEEEKKEMAAIGDGQETEPSKGMLESAQCRHLYKLLDEGKHEEAKEHLRKLVEGMPHEEVHAAEEDGERMSSLAKRFSALQTQFEELVALASPILGVKSEELR